MRKQRAIAGEEKAKRRIIVIAEKGNYGQGDEPGDEDEIEMDGERIKCVLFGVGGYDPRHVDGPPTPEEILKALNENE